MKINKRKNNLILKIILVGALVVAAGGVAVYAYLQNKQANTPSSTHSGVDYSPPTDEQKAAGDAQKEESIGKTDDGSNSGNSQGQNIEVSFSAINQADGQLLIRALIESISNDGACTLTLTKGRTIVAKTSGTQSGPSSSTCKGFNVPLSELSSGEWNVVLDVQIDSKKGSTSQKFTVQ